MAGCENYENLKIQVAWKNATVTLGQLQNVSKDGFLKGTKSVT